MPASPAGTGLGLRHGRGREPLGGLAEAVISQRTRHQGLGRTLAWLSMARPARGGPANPKECYGEFKNNPPVCVWWGGGTETELRSVSARWRALPLLHSRAPEPRTHTSMRTPVFASLGDSPLSLCMQEAEPQGAEARRAHELQLLLPGRAPRALCSRASNPAGGWRRQGRHRGGDKLPSPTRTTARAVGSSGSLPAGPHRHSETNALDTVLPGAEPGGQQVLHVASGTEGSPAPHTVRSDGKCGHAPHLEFLGPGL